MYELYVHSWSDGAMLKSMAIRSWRSQPCKKSWRSRKFPRFASTLTHIDSHWLWFCFIWLNKVQLWLRHKCIIWQKLTYNPYNLLVAISRCVKDINVTITVAVSEFFFFSDNNMFWNACWEQVQVVNKVVEVWEFQWQLQIAEPDTCKFRYEATVWVGLQYSKPTGHSGKKRTNHSYSMCFCWPETIEAAFWESIHKSWNRFHRLCSSKWSRSWSKLSRWNPCDSIDGFSNMNNRSVFPCFMFHVCMSADRICSERWESSKPPETSWNKSLRTRCICLAHNSVQMPFCRASLHLTGRCHRSFRRSACSSARWSKLQLGGKRANPDIYVPRGS